MDNELSTGMMLTVELIVLSAVIGVILLFAGIGQQFQRSALASITDVAATAYGSEITALGELGENGDSVPVATLYLVLERNTDLVQSVEGRINKTREDGTIVPTAITRKEDLKDFFGKKVKVEVTKTAQDMFIVRVEE